MHARSFPNETRSFLYQASPELLVPHLATLLPYLKAGNHVSNEDESVICTKVRLHLHTSPAPRPAEGASSPTYETKRDESPRRTIQVANMAAWTLPLVDQTKHDVEDLRGVINDLVKITYRFGSSVVHAAVEALVVLTQKVYPRVLPPTSADGRDPRATAAKPLLDLTRQFYGVLRSNVGTAKLSQQERARTQRGLVVLGYVCRY